MGEVTYVSIKIAGKDLAALLADAVDNVPEGMSVDTIEIDGDEVNIALEKI